jgi:hypothetical protein
VFLILADGLGAGCSGSVTPLTVHALRSNPPVSGTAVSLTGVVIVGGEATTQYGELWVQDAGGGPWSGIVLFCGYGGTVPTCSSSQYAFTSWQP